jgi:anaerobic magnesium-protoporphyrin IX monomethyl ester cyclase
MVLSSQLKPDFKLNYSFAPKNKKAILLITGFANIQQRQVDDMGITQELLTLASLTGKSGLRLTIPTIGPAILASYLQKYEFEVEIKDFFSDDLTSIDNEIVGVSSTFLDIHDVREIIRHITQKNEKAIIILGGPLSWSMTPEHLFQELPDLNYIVMREGEETFLELVSVILSKKDPGIVNGIAFRSGNEIIETQPRPYMDVNDIPFPAWELLGIPSSTRLPVLPVETSRGCLYNCAYCSEVHYWGKPPRYFSADRIVNELIHNVDKFGIHTFRFSDSCFSAPPERCMNVCDRIYEKCISQGIKINWSSYGRINTLNRVMLEKMKRSGCVALDIGVESGDNHLLHEMNRGYTTEHIKDIAHIARELDIITNFNFVIGFPGETVESIRRTAELIDEACPDTYSCFQLFIAPHSNIYLNKEKYGIEGEGLNWKHRTMTSDQAALAMAEITNSVTGSSSFPGGEYCACYLTSLGYTSQEIRGFYRSTNQLSKDPTNSEALCLLKNIALKVKKYF